MNVLVVGATEAEAIPLRKKLRENGTNSGVHFLITGVGIAATTYFMTNYLLKSSSKYDLALSIGLAGTFSERIKIGDVVVVNTDEFADLGAEDGDNFLSVFEIGLMQKDGFPFSNGRLVAADSGGAWKKVKAITVNTVHGNEQSIRRAKEKYNADIESMEGAAFHYVCAQQNIPAIQMRAISNRVERRNKDAWNIPLALNNLTEAAYELLEKLRIKN